MESEASFCLHVFDISQEKIEAEDISQLSGFKNSVLFCMETKSIACI